MDCGGYELFSSSAFPPDENGDVRIGDLQDGAKDGLQLGALTDDLREEPPELASRGLFGWAVASLPGRVEFSGAIEQDGDGQQHGDPVLMLPGPAGGLYPGGSEIELPGPGLSEVYAGSDRPALIAGVGKTAALAVR
jgi:hypothetical protein